ncbi:hypothetical protein [Tahibacter soli]|uniref:Uncharacterized protein n=1 Tax=Tahibacter soli TaxID=2983605 RepID=A0A9X3YPH5_9GAMM|nr:hypothetical protein [Tahibacter soli]MDC8015467.1 hypothetical protein [Tahibacter soli]
MKQAIVRCFLIFVVSCLAVGRAPDAKAFTHPCGWGRVIFLNFGTGGDDRLTPEMYIAMQNMHDPSDASSPFYDRNFPSFYHDYHGKSRVIKIFAEKQDLDTYRRQVDIIAKAFRLGNPLVILARHDIEVLDCSILARNVVIEMCVIGNSQCN